VADLRFKLSDLDRRVREGEERDQRRHSPYRKAMKGRKAVAVMSAHARVPKVAEDEEWDMSGWSIPATVESSELSDYRSDN
jgi:hypothetical protein